MKFWLRRETHHSFWTPCTRVTVRVSSPELIVQVSPTLCASIGVHSGFVTPGGGVSNVRHRVVPLGLALVAPLTVPFAVLLVAPLVASFVVALVVLLVELLVAPLVASFDVALVALFVVLLTTQ